MRRILALFVSLMLAATLCACGASNNDSHSEGTPEWGIELISSHVTPSGMILLVKQSGGNPSGAISYGNPFWIEKKVNGKWETVETLSSDSAGIWTTEAYTLKMNGETEIPCNWEQHYGTLPAGHYRLCKVFSDSLWNRTEEKQPFSVEFRIE